MSDVDLQELERHFIAGKAKIKEQGALNLAVEGNGTLVNVSFHVPQDKAKPEDKLKPCSASPMFSIAKGTSITKGQGQFLTKYVPVGLPGAFRLKIDAQAARLFEKAEQIWFWDADKGKDYEAPEVPIKGEVDIVFDHKVVAALADLLSTLYD